MPRDPDPMAETSARTGRVVAAPARAPRAGHQVEGLKRDCLLRVLSCLDSRQAVQTCLLSQVWRDLWRDVPRINASVRMFEIEGEPNHNVRDPPFKKFFNRLLMLRNPVALDVFRLEYCMREQVEANFRDANLWVGHALLCNAQSIEVSICGECDKLDIDPAVFTSKHLRSLLFDGVNLTRGFFRQLQTGCNALERLILQACPINDIEISSQTLRSLSIGKDCLFECEVQASISAPNLIHFGFFRHTPYKRIPLLKNMESLVTAYITLDEFPFNGTHVDDIRQFLLGLSGVTKLDLYFEVTQLEVMGNNLQWCPEFNNLKFLTLGKWCLDANFCGLIAFLQNSPNLEQLTLDLKEGHVDKREPLVGEQGCLREHLMTVEIICPEHGPPIDSLVEFFVGSGMTSDQIHIKH